MLMHDMHKHDEQLAMGKYSSALFMGGAHPPPPPPHHGPKAMRYAEPSSNRAPLLLEGAQASSGPTPIHCDYSGTSDTFGPLSKVKKCTY